MPGFTNARRTCLITGAAGVLGRAAVHALLEEKHRVVLVDIDEGRLQELKRELPKESRVLALDLSNVRDIERKYRALEEEGIEVDVLINNAGILTTHKIMDTSVEEWEKILAVNTTAAFYLSKLVIPTMKRKGWGRIINISSLAAKTGGLTAGTAYTVSKGALISLTFSLAAELAALGITVNAIAPAYVRTPMVTEQLTAEQRKDLLKKIPVGRFCEPEECAHVVRFLVDEKSGFITGEIIDQNGGLHFD
jgi:3-oxoacyl-[acyl-carrier protein] reductase